MSYYEIRISIADAVKDGVARRLMAFGCLGIVEQDDLLVGYFPEAADIDTIITDLDLLRSLFIKSEPAISLDYEYGLIAEQDWNESWKKNFTPIDVGTRFTVLPPWTKPNTKRINLIIDPGMAFGTGHHETTRSCLVLMEKYCLPLPRLRFLDLGAGTGLLAIAASKIGFKQVTAVDTDPLAVEATRMNAELNETDIEIEQGSIEKADGLFDCIAANIVSAVLILLAQAIASRLEPGGIAILSGILEEQAEEVVREIKKTGLVLKETLVDGKWVSLVFRK